MVSLMSHLSPLLPRTITGPPIIGGPLGPSLSGNHIVAGITRKFEIPPPLSLSFLKSSKNNPWKNQRKGLKDFLGNIAAIMRLALILIFLFMFNTRDCPTAS